MIITKEQLIQEGIIQGVKDNWGKGLIALGGITAANAGVFGPGAEKMVKTGKVATEKFLDDAGDWSTKAIDKMDAKYNHKGATPEELFKNIETKEPVETSPNEPQDFNGAMDAIADSLGIKDN